MWSEPPCVELLGDQEFAAWTPRRCSKVAASSGGSTSNVPRCASWNSWKSQAAWMTCARHRAIDWKLSRGTGQGSTASASTINGACFVWRDGAAHDVEIVDYH